jgi:O-succinylbenzoate synthase
MTSSDFFKAKFVFLLCNSRYLKPLKIFYLLPTTFFMNNYTFTYEPYTLKFLFEAGTSRGVMRERKTYFIYLKNKNGIMGVGEAAPLDKLSPDATPNFEQQIEKFCYDFSHRFEGNINNLFANPILQQLPSLYFALETALLDYKNGGQGRIFDTPFSRGQIALPINGLIWMGNSEFMYQQIAEKLAQGYKCLKLKIGAIDFEEELRILHHIRQKFSAADLTLRVDANGAFSTTEAMDKLNALAKFDLHSIEQPIQPKQHEAMHNLCLHSPIPIAFDEELIGIQNYTDKEKLLTKLKPQYIVLKPTLVGGFAACDSWIEIAEKLQIGWWLTSALESNIGLNAICQYTAHKILGTKFQDFPQGLGTGQLYSNNIAMPLLVKSGFIQVKE